MKPLKKRSLISNSKIFMDISGEVMQIPIDKSKKITTTQKEGDEFLSSFKDKLTILKQSKIN